jgi:hypothetical protein
VINQNRGDLVVGKLVQAAQEIVLLFIDHAHQMEDDGNFFSETRAHAVDQRPFQEMKGDLEIPAMDGQQAGKAFQVNLLQKKRQWFFPDIMVHNPYYGPQAK